MNFKNPEGQTARWIEVLSSYDMKVEHRPGRSLQNADGVSRIVEYHVLSVARVREMIHLKWM